MPARRDEIRCHDPASRFGVVGERQSNGWHLLAQFSQRCKHGRCRFAGNDNETVSGRACGSDEDRRCLVTSSFLEELQRVGLAVTLLK